MKDDPENWGSVIPSASDMGLTDWFAGQALAGLVAKDGSQMHSHVGLAKQAYGLAEAMVEERRRLRRISNK